MKIFFILFVIAMPLFISPVAVYAEVVDKIAIIVNNEIITQQEIDRMLIPVYEQYRAMYHGDELTKKLEEARQKIIEQLIDDKLILAEARRQNIEVEEKEVDIRVEEAARRFGSKEKFDEVLKGQRLTIREVRTRYREQLMMRRLIDQRIGSGITITPVEISAYYNKHINEFAQPEGLKLRNILIKVKEGPGSEKESGLAGEISATLKGGGDFAELAKTYSEGPGAEDGGLMGYVKRGDLLPEIEKVVFALSEGEVSDVIQTGVGYHIFKVEEKMEPRNLSITEARRDIEDAIYQEKIKEKVSGWLSGLKKNAYIAFK